MRIGLFIKQSREKLGLKDSDFAELIGISVDTLSDFEEYDDDEINSLTIPELKRMCLALNIDHSKLFKLSIQEYGDVPLAFILVERLKERNLSKAELAELIGYDEVVIEALETGTHLDQVCIEAVKKVSIELDIPLDLFLSAF